jgi:hypothetical protein
MFRYAVMQYWVHEYINDTYVCEKCKFILFNDSPSYLVPCNITILMTTNLANSLVTSLNSGQYIEIHHIFLILEL